MKISYRKLWIMLIERDISNTAFRQATELPPGTMSKLSCALRFTAPLRLFEM